MANHRKGELDVSLLDINYKLTIDNDVISEFESLTGQCFVRLAITAISAYDEAKRSETRLSFCEIMSSAVTRADAARLVYLAAKKNNSQVEFKEIQHAFINDLDLSDDSKFYPVIFVDLATFAIFGNEKKK